MVVIGSLRAKLDSEMPEKYKLIILTMIFIIRMDSSNVKNGPEVANTALAYAKRYE